MKPRARRAGHGIGYSREFLERLARILVHSGHSPKKLAREFRVICSQLKEPSQRWNPVHLNYLADLPHVMAHWHADPLYLDAQGEPAPLPLRARGRSLTGLIAQVLPGEDPRAVVQSLLRLRGIRRQRSAYLPTDRQLVYRDQRDSARVHGLMALLGILRTIEHNVSRAPRDATILERTALNPRFPVCALPAFHRRLEALAEEFLWNADGHMRRRESLRPAGPTTRLGVGVFAFEDPRVTGRRAVYKPQSRRRRTPR